MFLRPTGHCTDSELCASFPNSQIAEIWGEPIDSVHFSKTEAEGQGMRGFSQSMHTG